MTHVFNTANRGGPEVKQEENSQENRDAADFGVQVKKEVVAAVPSGKTYVWKNENILTKYIDEQRFSGEVSKYEL